MLTSAMVRPGVRGEQKEKRKKYMSALAMMRPVVQICFYKNEYRNKNKKTPQKCIIGVVLCDGVLTPTR
jgi:hypothetical protein